MVLSDNINRAVIAPDQHKEQRQGTKTLRNKAGRVSVVCVQ